ncbi:MAG: class IV adenylate cyclase [Anaerolineae bacterium]
MTVPAETGSQTAGANLEVEVKFLVPDLAALRAALLSAGGHLHKPRVFERNVRFDTADDGLLQRGELLRLRQDTAVTLTFKGIPAEPSRSEAKVREEFEIKLDDFDTAAIILGRLGYQPKQVYEKYRETFRLGRIEVVLDEMPFGNFVELEGDEAAIKAAAAALGLDWNRRITTNYLALMALLKTQFRLPFNDVTFSNFEAVTASVADVVNQVIPTSKP